MKYIWKGPPTAVEVFEDKPAPGKEAKVLFSGPVATDREIDADLPTEHPQIVSWLAFKLIEAVPAANGEPAKAQKIKEQANG